MASENTAMFIVLLTFFFGSLPRRPMRAILHPQTLLRTPQLDTLARDGVHLKNAFVSTALCSPNRASILTGLYAHRHKIVDNNTAIPQGTRFFPQLLQRAGYKTGFIGEWHMGNTGDQINTIFGRSHLTWRRSHQALE